MLQAHPKLHQLSQGRIFCSLGTLLWWHTVAVHEYGVPAPASLPHTHRSLAQTIPTNCGGKGVQDDVSEGGSTRHAELHPLIKVPAAKP